MQHLDTVSHFVKYSHHRDNHERRQLGLERYTFSKHQHYYAPVVTPSSHLKCTIISAPKNLWWRPSICAHPCYAPGGNYHGRIFLSYFRGIRDFCRGYESCYHRGEKLGIRSQRTSKPEYIETSLVTKSRGALKSPGSSAWTLAVS